jgi:hypothetical protein
MSLEMLHNSLDASGRDTELLVAAAWWLMERRGARRVCPFIGGEDKWMLWTEIILE